MAHTQQGRELTEEHRKAQASITAQLVAMLASLFAKTFDIENIDESTNLFIRQALPHVMKYRSLSAQVSVAYLDAFSIAEAKGLLGDDGPSLDETDPLTVPKRVLNQVVKSGAMSRAEIAARVDYYESELPGPGDIARSLYSSTAGVAKKQVKQGNRSDGDISRIARDAMQAKAVKVVQDGGRKAVEDEVNSGRNGAIGYCRVVDPDPCPFCAMLASRGAVYRTDSFEDSNVMFTGDGRFKVHDGCGCTMEPVYGRRVSDLPPGSREYAEKWGEIAAGRKNPWLTWQRYIESGTLPKDDDDDPISASAPQKGRERRRLAGGKKRKSVDELDGESLEKALKGMYVRRAGLERDLADFEARGMSVSEPGPAAIISTQLERLEKQIAHAEKKRANMR